MPRWILNLLLPVIAGAAMVAVWYAVHAGLSADYRFLLPSPGQVIGALHDNAAVLWHATLNTGAGALLGFSIATLLSIILALGLSVSPLVRAGLYPYLMILQMMPVIVIAPILVLWVGPGLRSVTIITVLICFFPLVVNTTQGLISTDQRQVELFRMWRTSRWQQLTHLRLPSALPYFFTGMRIAAVLAPIGALVGDYTAGSSAGDGGGLGFQTIIYSSQAEYPALFATAAVTCVLGFVFTGAVVGLSWLALHAWHDAYDRPDR
ncbi:MAG TPA: ABC transporter permease [Opitutaceae bacterium]|nr:ABC transporter permease [Opitutaceae bacterium]